MPQHSLGVLQYLIPLLILVPVLYFRMRRMIKARPLKLSQLWIRPALIVVAAGAALTLRAPNQPPPPALTPPEWAGLALAAALGAMAGWHYGRAIKIEVDPQNGTLMTKGSIAAMLVIVVLVLVKLGLRPLLAMQGGTLHLDVLLITDASIVFSVFLFTVRSLEMYLRAKKVMAERR
jgi:hypothetical protein